MITEAFTLTYNEEKGYIDIDRTYKYGGIMLLADALNKVCLGGIDGYTFFEEFSLKKWSDTLGITEAIISLEVSKDCDGMINHSVCKEKINDVLSISITNGLVTEVKNNNGEIIYTKGDNFINDWKIGWFGKVYDYYTNIISYNIEQYDEEYDSYIWGVFYE